MKKFLVICAVLVSASMFMSSCGDANAKTYQCPMKCEGAAVTYDKPGECPMCTMPLEEIK